MLLVARVVLFSNQPADNVAEHRCLPVYGSLVPSVSFTTFPFQINYLISCIQLLVRAKAQEIKYKARMKRQQEQQGGSGGSAVAAPDGKTDKVDKKTQ